MSKAEQIYERIMKRYRGLHPYIFTRRTSKSAFEEDVWLWCKPDKELANDVMAYADKIKERYDTKSSER